MSRAAATEASASTAQLLSLGVGEPSQGATIGGTEPNVVKIHWFSSAIQVAGCYGWGGSGSGRDGMVGSGSGGDVNMSLVLLCTSKHTVDPFGDTDGIGPCGGVGDLDLDSCL